MEHVLSQVLGLLRIAAEAAPEPVHGPHQLGEQTLGRPPVAESRRLVNERMKRELRLVLRYPTVADGLAVAAPVRTRE